MSIESEYERFLELTGDAHAAATLTVGVHSAKSPDDLLSVADVAAMLHISNDKVRGYVRAGRLAAADLNRGNERPHFVIRRSAVYDFLDSLAVVPDSPRHSRAKRNGHYDAGDWA